MNFDRDRAIRCIIEIEAAFIRAGALHCDQLQDQSHLAAFLLAGLRSHSLLHSMVGVLQEHTLDAYECIRRAFYEAWLLQFDFRFKSSSDKARAWFGAKKKRQWKPEFKKLERFIRGRGQSATFGIDYGLLSMRSHPTFDAAAASCALVTMRHGVNAEQQTTEREVGQHGAELMGFIVQAVWVTIESDPAFIQTNMITADIPECHSLCNDYFAEVDERNNERDATRDRR